MPEVKEQLAIEAKIILESSAFRSIFIGLENKAYNSFISGKNVDDLVYWQAYSHALSAIKTELLAALEDMARVSNKETARQWFGFIKHINNLFKGD